ncbi:MAG: stage II sporulation protein R [Oscillospiraceae bacterium]|nr:stage II sporulation protein R [Oscillospiraceae bacterium]
MLRRFELAILIGIIVGVMFTSLGVFAGESEQIRSEVFRLHLLPNSDSDADQALKLHVRDALLAGRADLFSGAANREEVISLTSEHLESIVRIAQDEILRRGYDYPITAEIVNMHFSTRDYREGLILPAGRYDAVRVTIGEGGGENWWCVMFPPICLPAASAEPTDLEEQIARLGQTSGYRPKFAVVEIFERLRG